MAILVVITVLETLSVVGFAIVFLFFQITADIAAIATAPCLVPISLISVLPFFRFFLVLLFFLFVLFVLFVLFFLFLLFIFFISFVFFVCFVFLVFLVLFVLFVPENKLGKNFRVRWTMRDEEQAQRNV